MVDWTDPETFWLNVTNAALGLVVLVAVLALVGAVGYEVVARVRKRVPRRALYDGHAMMVPGLGVTMADGGEKLDQPKDGAADEKPQTEAKS